MCFHPSVSLNNDKICCKNSGDKIAVCEKTASLQSGKFSVSPVTGLHNKFRHLIEKTDFHNIFRHTLYLMYVVVYSYIA